MAAGGYLPISQDPSESVPGTLSHSWTGLKWRQTYAKLRPRRFIIAAAILVHLLALVSFLHWDEWRTFGSQEAAPWSSDATNFDSVFAREAVLPQHNLLAPYPEGKEGHYLRFSNQVRGTGWNNILQERLLNTILAYKTDRAPVFSPFEAVAHPPRNDTAADGQRKILTIPFNALLSGPASGMSWGPKDRHPRAVNEDYWELVCPESERRIVDANEIMKQLGHEPDGLTIMTEWTKLIGNMSEKCIEIKGTQIFDVNMISLRRVLTLWDMFKSHPTVRLLEDSEIVKNAVSRNINKFQTPAWSRRLFGPRTDVIPGLLGIHVRRGDFVGEEGKDNGHRFNLGRWSYSFTGWNQLPELPDQFVDIPRAGVPLGNPEFPPGIKEYYTKHCLPTPQQMTSRIRQIRQDSASPLTHIFIATNAEDDFLVKLRRELAADGWVPSQIITSRDLELNWQATSVSNVVDMSILSRAEVFVGNGWSSLSSNVVMRRLTDGLAPQSIRFW